VLDPAVTERIAAVDDRFDPLIATKGVPEYPLWLVPSMSTGLVIAGRALSDELNVMVWSPEPDSAKSIVSGDVSLSTCVIAQRNEPWLVLSVVVVTL
jgi:hypothetical protein